MHLTESQIKFFHSNGYLVVKREDHQIFTAEQIQQWSSEVESWELTKGKWMVYNEINVHGNKQVMRVEKFADYHGKFQQLLRGPELTSILEALSGANAYLFKDKINFKYSNGSGFGAHTDAPAYTHVGDIKHITVNIAIDEATLANGCLEVVEGSHVQEIDYVDNAITKEWEETHTWMPVPLKAGDLLIFGSYLAHRSGPNRSLSSRRALYATYHSSEEGDELRNKYYTDRAIAFPPDNERVPGKDYSAGILQYAFAAPFTTTV
jgi:hypothetical protein